MKLKKSKVLFILTFVVLIVALGVFFKIKSDDEKRHTIPIAMALDDGYIYPTIVAITSMMENKKPETRYDYYVMHPGEFKEENKEKLKSLEKKYKNCKINLIDMKEKHKDSHSDTRITTAAYYRLSLSEVVPYLDKIIWLDGDTLTFSDLKEMYNIDMQGYYYKGILDEGDRKFLLVKENDHPICSGVMLVNLSELRKDDMVNKISDFIKENNDKLCQHDQSVVNALCYEKVGVLPAKYGIFNYHPSIQMAEKYVAMFNCKEKYSAQEVLEAYKKPVVLHCISKPWKSKEVYGFGEWWSYAKKTDYYDEIVKAYPIN